MMTIGEIKSKVFWILARHPSAYPSEAFFSDTLRNAIRGESKEIATFYNSSNSPAGRTPKSSGNSAEDGSYLQVSSLDRPNEYERVWCEVFEDIVAIYEVRVFPRELEHDSRREADQSYVPVPRASNHCSVA